MIYYLEIYETKTKKKKKKTKERWRFVGPYTIKFNN